MELLILLIAFVVLDVAVYLWGVDTRDGKDWQWLGNPRRGARVQKRYSVGAPVRFDGDGHQRVVSRTARPRRLIA